MNRYKFLNRMNSFRGLNVVNLFYKLVLFVTFFGVRPLFAHQNTSPNQLLCSKIFFKLMTFEDYLNIRNISGEFGVGFKFNSNEQNRTTVKYSVDIPNKYNVLRFKEKRDLFNLIDVGYVNFNSDFNTVVDIVKSEVQDGSNKNIEIYYSKRNQTLFKMIQRLRWIFHAQVIDNYKNSKKYIDESSMNHLISINYLRTSSNVLGLIRDTSKSLLKMTDTEIIENLILTIQISYASPRMHHRPMPEDFGIWMNHENNYFYLPFVLRLRDKNSFLKQMWKDFNGRNVVEFARYVRFKSVSTQVHAKFLLNAFTKAKENGAEIIIASTDHITSQLFMRKYHFSLYKVIPGATSEQEYLIFIDLNSDNFQMLLRTLRQESSDIGEHQIVLYP